jgi:hypothetical protein
LGFSRVIEGALELLSPVSLAAFRIRAVPREAGAFWNGVSGSGSRRAKRWAKKKMIEKRMEEVGQKEDDREKNDREGYRSGRHPIGSRLHHHDVLAEHQIVAEPESRTRSRDARNY